MIISTHQPIFLPWPGFFYKALQADIMVLLDDVQFPLGRSWMTRNRMKCEQGELLLTVPVWKKGRGKQIIREVEICYETNWSRKHLLGLKRSYAHAPYREDYLPAVEAIYTRNHRRLANLNLELTRLIWDALGVKTKLILQSDLHVSGTGTALIVSICRAVGADGYATLPIAGKYLDPEQFHAHGIRLIFPRFAPPVYPQLWGDLRYNLSALDLLLNCGPRSLDIIARSH